MIVIVNGAPGAGQEDVAVRLAARMANGSVAEADRDRVGELRERGVAADFVIPGVFSTWSNVRALRRALAPIDAVSYAFRLVRDERALTPEAVEVQRLQEREASEGDLGLPVPDVASEQAARFIWEDVHEPVALASWSDRWRTSFERERQALSAALGDRMLLLEHVGSTAIEGLEAKPIIDMVLAVPSLERTRDYLPPLRELGYHFLDYPTNTDRYFFKKGRPRTHHLHVGEPNCRALTDQVLFRDRLRASPALRDRYAALKRELEGRFRRDRAGYSESKGAFVARVLSGD